MPFIEPPSFKVPHKLDVVTFAVSTWCNLQCAGCGRTVGIEQGTWANKYMTLDIFERALANLPEIGIGILQGVGEPTMNPEFLEICRAARASGKIGQVMFHTNGITRNADYLQEASRYVDLIQVSVDTLNAAYVPQTRAGTDVKKLHKRLTELVALGVRVGINMVVSRHNVMDIPSTLKILNDIGRFIIHMQPFEAATPAQKEGCLTESENRLMKQIIAELRHFLPNLTVQFPLVIGEILDNSTFCSAQAPALSPYILPDGFLSPCCRSDDPAKFGHADIANHSFADLWQSDGIRHYVHRFIEQGDSMCTGCGENRRVPIETPIEEHEIDRALEQILKPAVNFALRLGDLDQALRFCRSFAAGAGDNPQALFYLVQILVMCGEDVEAMAVLDRLRPIAGGLPQVQEIEIAVRNRIALGQPTHMQMAVAQ